MRKSTPVPSEIDALGMSKFKLGRLKPKNTVWHTLDRVHIPENNPNPVRLEIQCSGRINAEYTSAILKLGKTRESEGDPTTSAALDASDARSLKLFAKHVVLNWDGVCDDDMKPIPFTTRDVEELLLDITIEQKSPDIVAPLLAHATEADSFRGNAEDLGKR